MNNKRLDCAICGKEFNDEDSVSAIIDHIAKEHKLGPKDLFIAAIISALTSSSFHAQDNTEAKA